jgi:hypothetical protein
MLPLQANIGGLDTWLALYIPWRVRTQVNMQTTLCVVLLTLTRKQQQQQCHSNHSRLLRAMARSSSKHSSARLEQQGHAAAAAKKWLTPVHREVSSIRQPPAGHMQYPRRCRLSPTSCHASSHHCTLLCCGPKQQPNCSAHVSGALTCNGRHCRAGACTCLRLAKQKSMQECHLTELATPDKVLMHVACSLHAPVRSCAAAQ